MSKKCLNRKLWSPIATHVYLLPASIQFPTTFCGLTCRFKAINRSSSRLDSQKCSLFTAGQIESPFPKNSTVVYIRSSSSKCVLKSNQLYLSAQFHVLYLANGRSDFTAWPSTQSISPERVDGALASCRGRPYLKPIFFHFFQNFTLTRFYANIIEKNFF